METETELMPQEGEFSDAPASSAMVQVASSREAQEVQARVIVARKFPRNENESFSRIMKSCKRKSLAATACYS